MLLSWIHGTNMAAEVVGGGGCFGSMSKAELLRGVITEKLTTAAQEIFAVVERTVTGYEEEASGYRQEIDRQRRQLAVLLQPEIKLETIDDQFPVCELAAEVGAELPEEDEPHKYEPSAEDSRGLSLVGYTEDPMEEEEEGQGRLTEPDNEAASRLSPPTVRSDRRKPGRPRISEPQDHVDLRIRILEDSQTEVLSASVYKKYPLQELQCPRGLQEADFLDLLRSTFPQLAAQKPFDVFTADRTKRLQPLKVKTLTPEEICGSNGHSTLYIRLKKMLRTMKRKRTAGPNPQGSSLDPLEQTATCIQQQPPPNITNTPYPLPRPTFPATSQFNSFNTYSSKNAPLTTFYQSRISLKPFPSSSNTHNTFAQIYPQPLITTTLTATNTATTSPTNTTNTASDNNTATKSATNTTATSHTSDFTPAAPPTQHTPTATPAPSTPKIFKEICSILPLSSGGKKKRCKITVEELARRVGPPEYMSFSSLAAYLRTDNNARRELQAQLEEAGIKPTQFTSEMSLFSRLCEEEVNALCESLAGLVRDHLPFQGLHVIPEDEVVTQGRLLEFWSHLRRATSAIKERVGAVDLASHGFMSKMLDIMLSVFEKCLEDQMSSTC